MKGTTIVTTLGLRNETMNHISAFSGLLKSAVSAGSTVSGVSDSVNKALSVINDSISALNEALAKDYVETHTFSDIVKYGYIPATSLSYGEDGTPSLQDIEVKVSMRLLNGYLPADFAEYVEALGRIAGYLYAYDHADLYADASAFLAEKVSEKTGKPSAREKKVQAFIKSLANERGGYSVKDQKSKMHAALLDVSQGSVNVFFTSALYDEWKSMSVKRGDKWGTRKNATGSEFADMFLEYVHMILNGQTKMQVVSK